MAEQIQVGVGTYRAQRRETQQRPSASSSTCGMVLSLLTPSTHCTQRRSCRTLSLTQQAGQPSSAAAAGLTWCRAP